MQLEKKVETYLNSPICSSQKVGGGCIADARVIRTEAGDQYFLKTRAGSDDMFLKEANGLAELSKANAIRCPKVIAAEAGFLLLEYIESGPRPKLFYETFGRALASMHRYQAPAFGFYEDNYIGASVQYNKVANQEGESWPTFYFNKRLLPQLHMARQRGLDTEPLTRGIGALESKVGDILQGSDEPPALLHGDLWSGNYLCDNKGAPVLIDPAAYYGHREADLAMTKMFGGFSPKFYAAYQESYPLPAGWKERENIYLLYHYLNHYSLFGEGYYQACIDLIRYYTA